MFELFQMDVEQVFWKDKKNAFGWNPVGSKLHKVPASELAGAFNAMIVVKNAGSINDVCEKREIWDGMIAFEYDKAAMKARLKLFDNTGKELALIKLPLEKNGAMKHSLLKHVRRGAVWLLSYSFLLAVGRSRRRCLLNHRVSVILSTQRAHRLARRLAMILLMLV